MSDKDETLDNNKQASEDATLKNEATEVITTEETTITHSPTEEQALVNEKNLTPQGSQSGGIMKFIPWVIAIVAVVALIVVLVIDPSGNKEEVASVNGEKITKQELNEYMSSRIGSQVVLNMINEKLIDQETAKAGVAIVDADVDAELATLKKTYPSEDQFIMDLAQSGMTEKDLKDQLRTQLKIRKILEPQITVTDADVQKSYDENKESFATPEQVQASHILVDKKEDAEAILKELKNGADFATLAKEKSKDGSKDSGGDLGLFSRKDMVAEFSDAAFKLKVGDISEVVQSQFGFHIIKVTDKKAAVTPTFEEKKEEIRKGLVDGQLSTKVPTWLQEIKDKAKIVNKLDKTAKPEASPSTDPTATVAPK